MKHKHTVKVSPFEYNIRKLLSYIVYCSIMALIAIAVISVIVLIHAIPDIVVALLF